MPTLGGRHRQNVKSAWLSKQNLKSAANLIGGAYKTYKQYKASQLSRNSSIKSVDSKRALNEKFSEGKVYNEGRGGQFSETDFGIQHGTVSKRTLSGLAPITWTVNGAFQLKSLVGKQNAIMAVRVADNPSFANVGGNATTRLVLERVEGQVTIANAMLSNCTVDIYDCIIRRDVTSANYIDPELAWAAGYTAMAAGSVTNVGAQPWDSDNFNDYWKVFKQTHVTLGSGVIHTHKFKHRPNALISGPIGSIYSCFRGVTTAVLIVIRGAPANDTVNQALVGLGASAVNVIWEHEHKWKQMATSNESTGVTNNLVTSFTTAEQVVNEGTTIEPNALG